MTNLPWGETKNLEYSIIKALRANATFNGYNIQIRADKTFDESWQLPVVQIYYFSMVPGRLEIGSNLRFDTYVIMVDVRSDDTIPPIDIADWAVSVLNDGIPYYTFAPNPSSPDNLIETLAGTAIMDVFTSLPVNLGDNVDLFDKNRHRMTCKFWLTK